MKSAVLFAAIGIVIAGLLGAGQAQAKTFCANLPADVSCDQNFPGTTTSIGDAVEQADLNPGPDSVKVGPGVFTVPSPLYLSSNGDGNQLTLTGQGDSTVLTAQDPTDPAIYFDAPQGSSINSLTVSIPDDASNTAKSGLILTGGGPTANDLSVNFVTGTTGNKTTGVELRDGATLSNSTVTLYNTNVNKAVSSYGSGTQRVDHSKLTAFTDIDKGNAGGTLEVRKSVLVVIAEGAQNLGGTMNIRDSVIVAPFGSGEGTRVQSIGVFADTLIDGTTMLGTPGSAGSTAGAVALAASGDPTPANVHLRLNNSLIYGFDYAINYSEFFPEDILDIDVDSSAYDSTKAVAIPGLGTPSLNIHGLLDLNGVDPKLKDPGTGDYSLAPGSPLIDAGQAADPPVGSTDINGNPRACHGTASGVIRRDIGAYEYKTNPNDDCKYPGMVFSGPGTTTDTTPTYDFSSPKAGTTFTCSVDGAAFSACVSPYTTPALSIGPHTLDVKARDTYGNQNPNSLVHNPVTILAATCDNDTSLCNPQNCRTKPGLCPDKTAPMVAILGKVPKKTGKKSLKIRFRSSEAGSKFTCKVNKSKAKKCRSPFKAKLKKGKNTISIVATDKASNRSKAKKVVVKRKK